MEIITCTGCGNDVEECGYCEKDGSPYGDCCWTDHLDSCDKCAELNLGDKDMNEGNCKKFTTGFVTQTFEDGKCIEQEFTAANDDITYEDQFGDTLIPGTNLVEPEYHSFDMVQPEPGFDYYILKLIGLVEPILFGPFTKQECAARLSEFRDDPGEVENSHTGITVTKGAEIDT